MCPTKFWTARVLGSQYNTLHTVERYEITDSTLLIRWRDWESAEFYVGFRAGHAVAIVVGRRVVRRGRRHMATREAVVRNADVVETRLLDAANADRHADVDALETHSAP